MSIRETALRIGDGLLNLYSGLNAPNSKNATTKYSESHYSEHELRSAYHSSWILMAAIDAPLGDMLRARRRWIGDPEKIESVLAEEKRLNLWQIINDAMTGADVFGGSGIVVVTSTDDLNTPLEFGRGGLVALRFAEKSHLNITRRNKDPLSENYGEPISYRWSTLGPNLLVDRSRLIKIDCSKGVRDHSKDWRRGRLEFILDAAKKFDAGVANVAEMTHKAVLDALSSEGLYDRTQNDAGTEAELKKFSAMRNAASASNMLLFDSKEELIRHSISFQGLDPVMKAFAGHVAAAADVPVTRLMGQSPGGLNSTGDGDARNYYDGLAARQMNELAPILEALDEVIQIHLFGEPQADLTYEFNSLWQETPKEQADREEVQVKTVTSLLQTGMGSSAGMNAAVDGLARTLSSTGAYAEAADAEELERVEAEELDVPEDDPEPEEEPDDAV